MRFDTDRSRAVVCDLPLGTVLLLDREPYTISRLVAEKGFASLKEAISQTLGIDCRWYLNVPSDTLSEVVERLDGFWFTVEDELWIKTDGLNELYLSSGTQKLSGGQTSMLLRRGEYFCDEGVQMREKLWRCALTDFISQGLSDKTTGIFLDLSADFDTDMNAVDAYSLSQTIGEACGKSCDIVTVALSGGWNADRFELDSGSLDTLKAYFNSGDAALNS